MCAFDKNRNLNYQRLQETGKDARKAASDVGDRFRSLGQNAGFYDKVGETLAKIQAVNAMLASTQLKFSNRVRWIHELLGTPGIAKGPSGIRQALGNDEFKFDVADVENALKDLQAQEKAVRELDKQKLLGSSGTTGVKNWPSSTDDSSSVSGKKGDSRQNNRGLSKVHEKQIEAIVSAAYGEVEFKVNAKGKRYKEDADDLRKKLKRILLAQDPRGQHKSEIRDLEKKIKAQKNERGDLERAENEYKSIVYILKEVVAKDAEEFIGVFTKKHHKDAGNFQQKITKMTKIIGDYKKLRSRGTFQNVGRGFKKKDLFALPLAPIVSSRRARKEDRRALKRATDRILNDPELGLNADEKKTKTFSKSLDSLVNAADKAQRLFLTKSTNQIAGYKRMSEQLIDAFIDLHRNVEKRGSSREEVIRENCKKAILLIRRQNRTYFFKEVIQENQRISQDLAEAALVKTDEVGGSSTRERSNAFSERSTRQRR